jgi:cysteine desulfurase
MKKKKRKIYLDHNATTPLHPEVKKAMTEAMDNFGNPSSLHEFGRAAKGALEKSRETVASFIGAQPDELIFVGSGSEANNTVLNIFACQCKLCKHDCLSDIITSEIEHPCIIETAKCLRERQVNIAYMGPDEFGKIDSEKLKSMAGKGTGLVSVMTANNEIGTIHDVKKMAEIAHKSGALFHTDAVQAVGKIPVNVTDTNVDFLTLSGHKIYGPKGVGAIYAKKGVEFCPFIRGGHQERGRRAGTENTPGIIGLAKAIEMRALEMERDHKILSGLKAMLKVGIEKSIKDVKFNGHPDDCLPNTLNVSFEGAEGEAILLYLDLEGIAISTGSACASGSLDPSHVLLATGLSPERAHGSVRFSMGRSTSEKDISYVLEVLPGVIEKVRSMSTVYKNEG